MKQCLEKYRRQDLPYHKIRKNHNAIYLDAFSGPLQTVLMVDNASINSHVHKVTTMINTLSITDKDKDIPGKRRIVVFFLVNPHKRIISTQGAVPQRNNTMTLDQALEHRLELMQERKFFKQDWNVREIELCEH